MFNRDMDPTKFFDVLLPCFLDILSNGKVSFASLSGENVSSPAPSPPPLR
jgi:transformation/transcription domain-associated protein